MGPGNGPLLRPCWATESANNAANGIDEQGRDCTHLRTTPHARRPGQRPKRRARVPGRRARWHNHLSPTVTKEAWSPEEDNLIMYWHKRVGNRWAEIAKHLDGRCGPRALLQLRLQRSKPDVRQYQTHKQVQHDIAQSIDAMQRRHHVSLNMILKLNLSV